jgi:hypothetical protein
MCDCNCRYPAYVGDDYDCGCENNMPQMPDCDCCQKPSCGCDCNRGSDCGCERTSHGCNCNRCGCRCGFCGCLSRLFGCRR